MVNNNTQEEIKKLQEQISQGAAETKTYLALVEIFFFKY